MRQALVTAPILIPPDWSKPFRCHVDASQLAVGGTLTQLDDKGNDRVISYYSRKLSDAEEKYTADERELLGLVYCLKRFRCYLEGSSFDVFTDNQVLKSFFTKPNLSRREARWLDLFAQFDIDNMCLQPGRVYVLGDVLSRAPHVMEPVEIGNLEASRVSVDMQFEKKHEDDQLFGPLFRAMNGKPPTEKVERSRVDRMLPSFHTKDAVLYYKGNICVPRESVRSILHLAHDCNISGHFAYAKTLARVSRFH